MRRFDIPDHPEIGWIERTGYPSWMQEKEDVPAYDEDREFDERRESSLYENP